MKSKQYHFINFLSKAFGRFLKLITRTSVNSISYFGSYEYKMPSKLQPKE